MASRSTSASYGQDGSGATLNVMGKRVKPEIRGTATILTGDLPKRSLIRRN
ncbi:hypothetical protein FH972_010664 [Carpinus fangiana]|uniref:Uncharacterized protein n=1 Tax=Carpinus fangiana TaxID=176857 RepID=A0A660KNZ0_9ROSI|nr:hypothetical protein FH972_010664 [Carpinus fangiana]